MIIACFKILGCGSYDIDQESISFSIQNMYLGLPGVVGVLKILNQEFDFNLKKKMIDSLSVNSLIISFI